MTTREALINMIKAADENGTGFLTAAEVKELVLKFKIDNIYDDADDCVEMFIKMGSDDADKKLKVEEAIKLHEGYSEGYGSQ